MDRKKEDSKTREKISQMSNKDFAPPVYWPIFSQVLRLFKLLGVMPITLLKIRDRTSEKLEVKFSRGGYILAVTFLIFSLIHTIWAPTMLIKLEKSVVVSILDPQKLHRNSTAMLRKQNFNTKLGIVVKVLHPLLVSLTTLSARFLSVSILAKTMPLLFKAIAQVDKTLRLPSNFYLTNFGAMTTLTVVSLILHVPIGVFHLWEVYDFREFWENVWEFFSMINVVTSFALELEFVLFCLSARSRFVYINNSLKKFISEEFQYDLESGRKLSKIFSKWKTYVRPRNRRIFSSNIKAKGQLFKLFLKMDAANGGRHSHSSLIELDHRKKPSEPETSDQVKSLRSGHILLHDVLHHVNDLYQVHLLVSISSSVTEILFNFYFTIFGFITSMVNIPSRIQIGELYLITVWSVYYCLRFMLIVYVAHFTASASKEAIKIISKIDPRKFEFQTKQEIKMLSEHLARRNFEFSACGLFNLNTSLISTSMSTGITYLVIMAQFH